MSLYGVGELTAVAILAELGDPRRFTSSRQAVRYAGLDITVHQSDRRRAPGHLSRQGPPALRWALYEAAQAARRPGSPDRAYYDQAAERAGRQPRLPRPGPQAAQAQLPHPARARRPSARSGLTGLGGRCALKAHFHTDAPRPAPRMLLPPLPSGRPPKTERSHRITREHPINHHVTDLEREAADRDKPGRPRASHPPRPPRSRPASHTGRPPTLTPRPGTDKQQLRSLPLQLASGGTRARYGLSARCMLTSLIIVSMSAS
jgi:hypothetical protein